MKKRRPISSSQLSASNEPVITIGIPIFEGFDSLDFAGPNQVFFLASKKTNKIKLCSIGPQKKVTSGEGIIMISDESYKSINIKLDVIFVPGGFGPQFTDVVTNSKHPIYKFLKDQYDPADKNQLICSVCTGALILAKAGLLNGYHCTTHWAYKNCLSLYPKVIVAPDFPRYMIDENRITGAGISSGIDEALAIVEIIAGKEIAKEVQLTMQYAPKPPINSGDPSQASPATLHKVSTDINASELYKKIEEILNT